MLTLYLSNGKALSPDNGKILFGPCRCGYCLPTATVHARMSTIAGTPQNHVNSLGEVDYYIWRNNAWELDNVRSTGLSGNSSTVQLPDYLRRTPCAVVPVADSSATTVSSSVWGVVPPSAGLSLHGVQRSGLSTFVTLGVIDEYVEGATAQTITKELSIEVEIPDNCAQYFIDYGMTVRTDGTRPVAIPYDHSATAQPNWTTTATQRETFTIPAAADPDNPQTVTRSVWCGVKIWLDPQYDQGLIGQ